MHNELINLRSSQNQSTDFLETPRKKEKSKIYFDTVQALKEFDQEELKETLLEQMIKKSKIVESSQVLWRHKDYHLSLALLRQSLNRDPHNYDLMRVLCDKLESVLNFQESLKIRLQIAKHQYEFETLAALATTYYKLNDDEQALEKYYEALALLIEESNGLFEVYKNMGNILVRKSDFEGAEEFYNKAYTLNPQSDVLLVNIGTLHIQKQDFEKAVYCFRKAVELNRLNDKAWVGLSLVHHQVGDNELALANLNEAISLNPGNRSAVHIYCAWAEKNQSRHEAICILQNYLSNVDCDEEMSLVLVNLYCQCGDFKSAAIECEKVLLWNPAATEVRELRKKLSRG
ncbi:MAG: tetratricopeptide repeat protein [Bdellovibrionia bacterium]